jgi:hypothetical protein
MMKVHRAADQAVAELLQTESRMAGGFFLRKKPPAKQLTGKLES